MIVQWDQLYPRPSREMEEQRKRLAPGPAGAFLAFSQNEACAAPPKGATI
jgi:hypothetical protein